MFITNYQTTFLIHTMMIHHVIKLSNHKASMMIQNFMKGCSNLNILHVHHAGILDARQLYYTGIRLYKVLPRLEKMYLENQHVNTE